MPTRAQKQTNPPADRPSGDAAVAPGMRTAAAWSWRVLVVAGVLALLVFLVIQLRLIVVPMLAAVLLAALLVPFSNWLQRHRWPKWLAVAVSEIGLIAIVAGLVTAVVLQVRAGFPSLQEQTLEKYEEFKQFLLESPLHISEADINAYVDQALTTIQEDSGALISSALALGGDVGHILAGTLIALFATLFILIDGRSIWSWIVRLFPQRARVAIIGAGEAGWVTLTSFVKAQVAVAAIDAVGIGIGAVILQLPLAIPIAIAVFLGSFIPFVGAVLTGALAVFVALVFHGPVVALIMLGIVLLVQQVEGHVLQPLLIGTLVKVHPLAVVLAVATGGFIAGIPGALFAVPTVAVANVVIGYLARGEWRTNPHPSAADLFPPPTRPTRTRRPRAKTPADASPTTESTS